jgi:hypothetical protein
LVGVALIAGLTLPATRADGAEPPPEAPAECSGVEPAVLGGGVTICGIVNPHSNARVSVDVAVKPGRECAGGRLEAVRQVEGEAVEVRAELHGLEAGTMYTACLVASNAGGSTYGESERFMIPGLPEAPLTEGCGPVGGTGWKLCGTLSPHTRESVSAYFALDAGSACAEGTLEPVGSFGGEDVPVSKEVLGLSPDAAYSYCLVARNENGTKYGNQLSFVTPPEAPMTEECGAIGADGWKLCGTVNPHSKGRVTAYFAISAGSACTAGAAEPAGELDGEAVPVAKPVLDLAAATEYTYCLVAKGVGGEADGRAVTFHTAPQRPATPVESTIVPPVLASGGPVCPPTCAASPSLQSPRAVGVRKPLTRAQKLAAALRKCRREPRPRRVDCERAARRIYGSRVRVSRATQDRGHR